MCPVRATMVRSLHGNEWKGSREELVSGTSWRDDKQRERKERKESPSGYREWRHEGSVEHTRDEIWKGFDEKIAMHTR